MEKSTEKNQPAKPISKKSTTQDSAVNKPGNNKSNEINADNDNGFVTEETEKSSNKGQGPAGENL